MKNLDQIPTLQDYTAFHGMLCLPDVAQRCIQSFEDGVSLFASQQDYDDFTRGKKKIADFDFNIILFPFNIWTYYLLTLLSLTMFSSLFSCTKVIETTERIHGFDAGGKDRPRKPGIRFKKGDNKHFESSVTTRKGPLRLPPEALDHIIDRSAVLGPLPVDNGIKYQTNSIEGMSNENTTPEIVLLRKFEFDFGGFLSVMMLHFVCTNGRMHLVEIFRYDTGTIIGLLGRILILPLSIVQFLVVKIMPMRQTVNTKKTT